MTGEEEPRWQVMDKVNDLVHHAYSLGQTLAFSTCSANFTPLCSQDRATMGSPSTRLPTGLSQLLARWSAMLQHLICPLASADRSREPVGSRPA